MPGKVAQPGATLVVKVSALDAHGNRFAVTQQRVKVGGARPAPALSPVLAKNEDPFADDKKPDDKDQKKGFWASPWPWAIGGAVLLGATIGTIAATRSPDTATVGAPHWQ